MAALAMGYPSVSFRVPALPWSAVAADEQRFRRILHRVLALVLLLVIVLYAAILWRTGSLVAAIAALIVAGPHVSRPGSATHNQVGTPT